MLNIPGKFRLIKHLKHAQIAVVISNYETIEESYNYAQTILLHNPDTVTSVIMDFKGHSLEVTESTSLDELRETINTQGTPEDNQQEMAD